MQNIAHEVRDALRDALGMTREARSEITDLADDGFTTIPLDPELAAIVAALTDAIGRLTSVLSPTP